jgi:hypothetical protein
MGGEEGRDGRVGEKRGREEVRGSDEKGSKVGKKKRKVRKEERRGMADTDSPGLSCACQS